ncbi:hypothetical protein [Ectothiorhodospira mobilis]|uniref:hypothetical protein n=1 Tax=Ectothiorhodospira mobilis TaxID=195064 RepID=UPI001EE7B6EE|nr:hypothetical protein [Ectothiorhodospira mobilis]MCG5536368.1 hypothetical protein [Ectothiorhodospira mobilis]
MSCTQTVRSLPPLPRAILAALLLLALSPAWGATQGAPVLESTSTEAKAGYYQLQWALEGAEADIDRFILQEARGGDFASAEIFYEGADRATVISGRRNGDYHYRVRAVFKDGSRSPWSPPLTVQVHHHSTAQAFGLFFLGGVVFFSTAGMIAAGSSAQRRADPEG